MKLVQYSPARDWQTAFPVGNQGMTARIFGRPGSECIELSESRFIRHREGKKGSRKARIGQLRLHMEADDASCFYERSLELDEGIAAVNWRDKAGIKSARAYFPKDYKIMVYELRSEAHQFNLQIDYQPHNQSDYINSSIGGIFFTSDIDGWVLCGKAALSTDGFPRVNETGITVKNASRVTLLIMLDVAKVPDEGQRQQCMLELQMQMNRSLIKLESFSAAQLKSAPKSRLPVYRKIKQSMKNDQSGKWRDGKLE